MILGIDLGATNSVMEGEGGQAMFHWLRDKLMRRRLAKRPLVPASMALRPQMDTVQGASGRFGYDKTNPIPVCMPGGEHRYLEGLRCPCGVGFAFERSGSFGWGPDNHVIDGYRLVCNRGVHQVRLFFDMYHGGASSLVPEGLSFEAPSDGDG